jgi:hypothetical protein
MHTGLTWIEYYDKIDTSFLLEENISTFKNSERNHSDLLNFYNEDNHRLEIIKKNSA